MRQWDGSVSNDWSVGGNWVGDLVPVAEDSVAVPIGVPNFPALVSKTSIMGVEVADGATLSLGAFNLSAGANVATGPTAGSGVLSTGGLLLLTGNSGVVQGRFPSLLVTGTYSLSGNVTAAGVQQVDYGELDNPGFEFLSDA